MAQLPPKIPSIAQDWASFATTTQYFQQQNSPPPPPMPSWVDDFLSFSSSRRGAHRRSASDSIAFLDDHQLMSMFSDDINNNTTNNASPSTPSDHTSNNDDKPMVVDDVVPPVQDDDDHYLHPKNEPAEVESTCNNDTHTPPPLSAAADSIIDPKRVKRILANRQSAQRSRVRKLQYISELERSVSTLQTEVSALSPRVAFLDHQRLILNVDNSALKQRIAALAQDKIFKDAHHEALKKEIERLRQIYEQQSLQKMEKSVNNNINSHNNKHAQGCTDNEHAPPMLIADQTTFT